MEVSAYVGQTTCLARQHRIAVHAGMVIGRVQPFPSTVLLVLVFWKWVLPVQGEVLVHLAARVYVKLDLRVHIVNTLMLLIVMATAPLKMMVLVYAMHYGKALQNVQHVSTCILFFWFCFTRPACYLHSLLG